MNIELLLRPINGSDLQPKNEKLKKSLEPQGHFHSVTK